MKIEKIVNRKFSSQENENINYFIKWFDKTNVAFVGEHCAVVLSTNNKEEMINNCMTIIEEIKKGPNVITSHVLEDGRGMLIMGHKKYYIQSISENELSKEEIFDDKMSEDNIRILKQYCEEALANPEIIALGLRHEFYNFMQSHYIPL